MLYPSVEDIKKSDVSRYAMVILAAKRARDIIDGAPMLVEGWNEEKAVSVAVSEIAEGKITCGIEDKEEVFESRNSVDFMKEMENDVESLLSLEDEADTEILAFEEENL